MLKPFFQLSWIRATWPHGLWLVLTVVLAGCDRDQIKVYHVAREPAAPPPATLPDSLPAGHPEVGSATPAPLSWTLPAGWEQQTPGEMRIASFSCKGKDGKQADVSIVPLGGTAGGDDANVNRWRGQVGLPPVSGEELKKLAQNIDVDGRTADLYDLAGQKSDTGSPLRILGAIQHRAGTSWFFKMTGDEEVVAQQKQAFTAFLQSIRFQTTDTPVMASSPPPVDTGILPAGHPDVSSVSSSPGQSTTDGHPGWQVPESWREMPAGQFLVAKFAVAGDDGAQAAVNVSRFAGDGGGQAANVNRWRKQLGLEELPDADVAKSATLLNTDGGPATIVELKGTDPRSGRPTRLVGAIVPQGGETWFYKLMGDDPVVEREKTAFNRFVQTAKY